MRQQMPHRDLAARGFVAYAKVGQIGADGSVKVDLPLLDEPHHRRRRERLGDGGDRKNGVSGDRQRVFDVGDAEPADARLALRDDAERDTGDALLLHLCFNKRHERIEAWIRGGLSVQHARRAARNREARGRYAGGSNGRAARKRSLS